MIPTANFQPDNKVGHKDEVNVGLLNVSCINSDSRMNFDSGAVQLTLTIILTI